MTDDLLTSTKPYVGLDEMAANFAEHLTRDELLLFIIALVEERGEVGFATDVRNELEDIAETDSMYEPAPEEDDHDDLYQTY